MDAFDTCSNCGSGLQAFYVKSGDQKQLLEIDGCRSCKGLWFDSGELERVLGKKLGLKWHEGTTRRTCARCKQPMRPWNAANGVTVEQCATCSGVFLDGGELTKLGAAEAEDMSKAALKSTVEFQCMKCQGHFPMREGNAMGVGLVCRNCVPMPTRDAPRGSLPGLDGELDDYDSGGSFLDVLDLFS